MVTKAVITCGGYATRFLPVSKAVPKELLPIGDKPVIHYIIDELVAAGITDVLILLGRGRSALMDYLDQNPELEAALTRTNSPTCINFFPHVNIYYRRVPMPRGAADCVWHAKSFIGNEPFIVAYCDDVFFNGNPAQELITDFQTHNKPAVIGARVPLVDAHKYGIISRTAAGSVSEIIEKPAQNPPGTLAAAGRYLLTPEIFTLTEQDMQNPPPCLSEVCMTRQLNKLAAADNLRAVKTRARRYDTGTHEGLHRANVFFTKTSRRSQS